MPPIVLKKQLLKLPSAPESNGVSVRCFVAGDESHWIRLHANCFLKRDSAAESKPWPIENFSREFISKPWWQAGRMLFAIVDGRLVGSVVLGEHTRQHCATLQWLMTEPSDRRRGVGRQLVVAAEELAIRLGYQKVRLETLGAWHDAIRLYKSLGYKLVSNSH